MLQSMADASPSKWHLAHTTWFFERFVLAGFASAPAHDPAWDYLFNSYYKSIGPAHARPQRGLLSRPSLQQVRDYRQQVDMQVQSRLAAGDLDAQALHHLQLGLQHEQQHQELLLTDIKHAFWCNPLQPAYREDLQPATSAASAQGWIESPERIVTIGAAAWPQHAAFAYDNESPAHCVLLPAHALAERPVSNGEYLAFIEAGGYREPRWWLSEGWALREAEGWQHPLYWDDALQREYTLGGWRAGPACAGLPPQLLRGRCLRPLGWCAPAQRVRVGSRGCVAAPAWPFCRRRSAAPSGGAGQWAAAAVRRCMGMDPQRVWRLSGLSPFRRQPR